MNVFVMVDCVSFVGKNFFLVKSMAHWPTKENRSNRKDLLSIKVVVMKAEAAICRSRMIKDTKMQVKTPVNQTACILI